MGEENPLESIETCLAFQVRDHSVCKRDAWIFGICCGWPPAAMKEVAAKHGWDAEDVARLRRLRSKWCELQRRLAAKEGQ